LIKLDDKNWLIEFLQGPTLQLAEGLTAIVSSPSRFQLAAGHIVQA